MEKMEIQERICKLCLKKCENFEAITGNTKNLLDILLPKMDLSVIHEPVMCVNCAERLKTWFDFRGVCLQTHYYIVLSVNNKGGVKLNLKDVYLSKNKNCIGVPEDENICGLCMGRVKDFSAVSVDVEKGDIPLRKMVERCLPELDFSFIKKPVICTTCHGSLEHCFRFVRNCLIVEEKIKEYRENLDINNKGQIELNALLQSTIRDVTTRVVDSNLVDTIKVEEQFYKQNADEEENGNGGDVIKLEEMFRDDRKEANDVDHENKSFVNCLKFNSEQPPSKNMLACKEENYQLDVIKIEETFCGKSETKHEEENLVKMEDQKCLLNDEIEIKTDEHDFNRFENSIVLPQSAVSTRLRLYRRKKSSKLNIEGNISKPSIKHTSMNKDSTKTTSHRGYCSFETEYKQSLSEEIPMYQCDTCLFQSRHKNSVLKHNLIHQNTSRMVEYDYSSYQAEHKIGFKTEVFIYNCNSCSFQSKNKYSFIHHALSHRDPSEVTMYKCGTCLYQTKYKYSLKFHERIHRNPSEMEMYRCNSCSFQTKSNSYLKFHMQLHKDPSEVTMYKCNSCSFQTKYRYGLKTHLLRHKDPSEVTMYECDFCSFKTKTKCGLRTHLRAHKDPSEVTMHRCVYCSFQTKDKYYLKLHEQRHKKSRK